ncbi:MAG: hypothetical protein JWP57_4515, partial [Spirosoma sp.]|nr:hypothetical protein [Spirosoma sp.]
MSTLDTALSLAAVGWYVFPFSAGGKPLVRWGEEATTDTDTIKRWFQRDDRRIGIHTGNSGLVVVDRDRKDGRDGFASLKAAGLPLPRTFHYTSRNGRGRHDFYAAPGDADLTIATEVHGMTGVDIRAGVGAIVYNGPALIERPTLAPAPDWALVHRVERDYDAVSFDAWLSEERRPEPGTKALRLAKAVPLKGVGNADLLPVLTPIVDALMWGDGRRLVFDLARERYTRHWPGTGEAFDRAWEKAVARVEDEWENAPGPKRQPPARETTRHPDTERVTRRTLQLTPASAIRPRPVVWLWDGRLALGTLSLLAGREGIGKSTVAYWIAARITRGDLDGLAHGTPRSVLVAATE